MIKIIALSRGSEKNEKTIEATFSYNGELVPLKVNEKDRPAEYIAINQLLGQPDINIEEVSQELFSLMSPEAKIRQSISDSYYLSGSLSIQDGHIFFGEERLEETLASHMLSLLNEDNVPKDEKMWRSYVKFLDNLHQNANEDIRKQLFRWMEYENSAGNAFGITDDGCLVGYKGCGGTVLEPMSVFSGNAIVDGVEYEGTIPNKVGSVIQMPRSSVQVDPSVGCSVGLHVGTRDYAVRWAPVLILVKVNPRDVVSVPYECESQKMRVCEYTVLKVTDAEDEHSMYHSSDEDFESSEGVITLDDAYDLLGEDVEFEVDNDAKVTGEIVDVYEEGTGYIVVYDEETEIHQDIELSRITYFDLAPSPDGLDIETAKELLEDNAVVYIIRDDDKAYDGEVVDVYVAEGKLPGIIIKSDEGKYSHIKLDHIMNWGLQEDDEEYEVPDLTPEEGYELDRETAQDLLNDNAVIYIVRDDDKEYVGEVVDVYLQIGKEPGVIIKSDEGKYSHIKLGRIIKWENTDGSDDMNDFEAIIADIMEKVHGEDNEYDEKDDEPPYNEHYDSNGPDNTYNVEQYKAIYELEKGTQVVIVKRDADGISAVAGKIAVVIKDDMVIIVRESDNELTEVNFTDILSLQVIE